MATKPLPEFKTMKVTDTRQQFSRVVNEVARGEHYVVVEKSGVPVEAIIFEAPGRFDLVSPVPYLK